MATRRVCVQSALRYARHIEGSAAVSTSVPFTHGTSACGVQQSRALPSTDTHQASNRYTRITHRVFSAFTAPDTSETAADNAGPSPSSSSDVHADLIAASLPYVPSLGWTRAALEAGAAALGLSPAVVGSLPRGPAHLVESYNAECNERLRESLHAERETLCGMPRRRALTLALRRRLSMAAAAPLVLLHTKSIHTMNEENHGDESESESRGQGLLADALALQASPYQIPHALSNYATIADVVLRAVGDVSTGTGWYTKRAALTAVYIAAELCLVQDGSEGKGETWEMVERQMDAIGDVFDDGDDGDEERDTEPHT